MKASEAIHVPGNVKERVHFLGRANYPASLPLIFADALANTVDIDSIPFGARSIIKDFDHENAEPSQYS
ncbi:hypothetical protein K7X08_023254 [Anisodus acutangulus]|uniref:Uncharacterized protein n=1 Tax=Anisodus acutangulus TaxID=402998 RepID=A0A9Q1LIC4_9SOLA|nr:hypothetical protein K7X08_023254 [Anisodus acutangulus]